MKKTFFVSTMLLMGILLVACNCTDCGKNDVKEECTTEEQCCDTVCPKSVSEGNNVDKEPCYDAARSGEQYCDTVCPGNLPESSDNIDNQ